MMMNYNELPEFVKDCKRLIKKYQSIPEDLKEFCKIISVEPIGNSKHFNLITKSNHVVVLKARFFCRYLKGSSLRIVYAYNEKEQVFYFIQLYFKGDSENEDKDRIKNFIKNL